MFEKMFNGLVEMAVANIAATLVRRKGISEKAALRQIYRSDFYTRLQNPKGGLYVESDAAQFDLFLADRHEVQRRGGGAPMKTCSAENDESGSETDISGLVDSRDRQWRNEGTDC